LFVISYTPPPKCPFIGVQKEHRCSGRLFSLPNVYFDVRTTYVVLTYDYMPPHIVFQAFFDKIAR
jgi:hypothetical protein